MYWPRPTARVRKHNPPITAAESEAEFLKIELNNARTEIVKLDSEIDSYKKKIVVLNARVKILSDRENTRLHDEYFPDAETRSSSEPAPPVTQPSSNCCTLLQCPQVRRSCCCSSHLSTAPVSNPIAEHNLQRFIAQVLKTNVLPQLTVQG